MTGKRHQEIDPQARLERVKHLVRQGLNSRQIAERLQISGARARQLMKEARADQASVDQSIPSQPGERP
jgi:transposase